MYITIINFISNGIAALVYFIVTWLNAEFFIPLRDHWSKRRYVILTIKLCMTAMAAFAPMVIYILFGVKINKIFEKL